MSRNNNNNLDNKKNLKKNNSRIRYFLYFLIFLVVVLIFKINNLEKNIIEYNTKLRSCNKQVSNLRSDFSILNNSYNILKLNKQNLELEKKNLIINLSKLNNNYSILKDETNSLLNDINIYQDEIKKSLEWYKANSILNNSINQNKVRREVNDNCIDITQDECRIKLGCFYLVNSEKLNLEYKYDESIYNKEDKLASINEFLDNKGGDCEDYSLFFKAEYNYALNECGNRTVVLEGWMPPNIGDKKTRYWLNFQRSWYLDDVVKIEIKNNIYPNIICGNLYDPIANNVSGHCMVAFTKQKIVSIKDLQELNNSFIIEPQDGSFKGNINNENSGIYLLNKNIILDRNKTSWISSVITDNDYFLFSSSDLKWNSYTFFNFLIEQKKKELFSLIN